MPFFGRTFKHSKPNKWNTKISYKKLDKTKTTSTTKVTKPLIIHCEKIPLSIQQNCSKELGLKLKSRFEISYKELNHELVQKI